MVLPTPIVYCNFMTLKDHWICECVIITANVLDEVQNKFITECKHLCHSDRPHCYIQLALVRDEMCDYHDKRLSELVRHTLQGHVDEIKRIKEPLERGLEDIFHYNNLPCPRLILILGAPGSETNVFNCILH